MSFYEKIKTVWRKALSPVTIMFIPHGNTRRTLNLNLPVVGVVLPAIFALLGLFYVCSLIPDVIRYQAIEKQLEGFSQKVSMFNETLLSIKKAEQELRALVSLGSKEKILAKVDTSDMGTFDISQVEKQIESSMQTVSSIRDYLRSQKDLYLATPRGIPVPGVITSPYGGRVNPITGRAEFHRGIDISIGAGTPVTATAEGVVSFAGWNGGGGNVVVIAHGQGFFTYYAHNRKIVVEVGQRVNRGEVIGYAGSTGSATGSHCHYEVWRDGKSLNPLKFIEERS
jgi:murein DD-endopeptidase MepM/ murein hydrolase activator NlpD